MSKRIRNKFHPILCLNSFLCIYQLGTVLYLGFPLVSVPNPYHWITNPDLYSVAFKMPTKFFQCFFALYLPYSNYIYISHTTVEIKVFQKNFCFFLLMKAVLRSEIFIPDPNFFHPGSQIRIKELKYFNPKIALGNMIRVVHPGSGSWFFSFYPSRLKDPDAYTNCCLFGLPDPHPDPLVTSTDQAPDPSIQQKETLISTVFDVFMTFLSLKNV